MEGASTGHTPGEISSVWGSTAAADVVSGGGGNRDTLGGCAAGKEVGPREHVSTKKSHSSKHLEGPAVGQGGRMLGQRQPSRGHRRKGVTTEDSGEESCGGGDDSGMKEGRQGRTRVRTIQDGHDWLRGPSRGLWELTQGLRTLRKSRKVQNRKGFPLEFQTASCIPVLRGSTGGTEGH